MKLFIVSGLVIIATNPFNIVVNDFVFKKFALPKLSAHFKQDLVTTGTQCIMIEIHI